MMNTEILEMLKVYIVFTNTGEWDTPDLQGVYRTKAAAQAWIDKSKYPQFFFIREEEVR